MGTDRPPIDVNSRGFVFVDHIGDLYPSGFLPFHCGNVTDDGLRTIYRDSSILQELRRPDGFGGPLWPMRSSPRCAAARALMYAVTGDHLAEDPTCSHQPA